MVFADDSSSSDDTPDTSSTTFKTSGAEYGARYAGDGTYYGETTAGNCAFFDNVPRQYDGMIPGEDGVTDRAEGFDVVLRQCLATLHQKSGEQLRRSHITPCYWLDTCSMVSIFRRQQTRCSFPHP